MQPFYDVIAYYKELVTVLHQAKNTIVPNT